MPIKSVKMKISKNKKMRFFLMSQGSLDPKISFLSQKVCSVARVQTDTQTDTKVNTEDTLSGFQELFLQPIIKDQSKTYPINYRLWFIVFAGIVKHQHKVLNHIFHSLIPIHHHFLLDCLHVNWLLNNFIVVWVIL